MTNIWEVPWGGTRSTGWKDVTLRLHKTGEELTLPVMISSKVKDIRYVLAACLGLDTTTSTNIEFLAKCGHSLRKLRPSDEIRTTVLIKNLDSFKKPAQSYDHPYCVIGAGHFGLRQAMHYRRHQVDFVLIDRLSRVGGNAWVLLANDTSCTQSEGCHYQLCYDPVDGVAAMKEDYGCWPSRKTILTHFQSVCDEYGVTPSIKLNTDVTQMVVPANQDPIRAQYDLVLQSTKEGDDTEDLVSVSNICIFPGAMVNPRVAEWPGEDEFHGQLEYAHGNMFDYKQVQGKKAIIIGCGAFANENIRTCIEFGVQQIYLVVRHLNVFLPRAVCWLVNQSINAPPGAMVFKMMEPIYNLIDWDIYSMPTVIANKDRTAIQLRQNARWGTGDIFFLAAYFGKVEPITAEVKRFKHHGAVLTDGTVLTGVEHVLKCLGFSGDFTVDKLMQTKQHIGFWPDGDWHRCVYAEFLAIDAGRFGGTAFGPGGASTAFYTLWYMQHPADAYRILANGVLAKNVAKPDLGKPAYDFPARTGSMNMLQYSTAVPDIGIWENTKNTPFKKKSIWHLQYPEKHIRECTEDWIHYSQIMRSQGSTKPIPPYPYTAKDLHDYAKMDEDLAPQAQAALPDQPRTITYGTGEAFAPAQQILANRSLSPNARADKKQADGWYRDALKTLANLRGVAA